MEKYLIVIEKTETGYSAFSPDVPGCITVADNIEGTIENMREAIELYLETIAEMREELPAGKGVEYHIRKGLLKESEIAEEYYLGQIEVQLPEIAH